MQQRLLQVFLQLVWWFEWEWLLCVHRFEYLISSWWNCLGRIRRCGFVEGGASQEWQPVPETENQSRQPWQPFPSSPLKIPGTSCPHSTDEQAHPALGTGSQLRGSHRLSPGFHSSWWSPRKDTSREPEYITLTETALQEASENFPLCIWFLEQLQGPGGSFHYSKWLLS